MSTSTSRVAQLVAEFESVNDAIIALVTACSDAQWRMPTGDENWPVAVVAHHVAEVNEAFARIVARMAAGEILPPRSSMDAVHQSNAQHARDFATVGKPETLALLRANGTLVARRLRDLTDERLQQIAGAFGDRDLRVEQVVELVVIGHARAHLESLRATLAA